MDMEGIGKLTYNITKLTINAAKWRADRKLDNAAIALGIRFPNAVARGNMFYNPAPGAAVQNITREEHAKIVANLLRYRGAVGPGVVNPNPVGTPAHTQWEKAHRSPFAPGAAHTQWMTARNAYAARPANEHDLLDRRMILLDGLTPVECLTSSDPYHNLDTFNRDRVRRHLPGAGAFDNTRESVQRMIRKKIDLKEETYQYLIKPILPTSLVRTFLPGLYSEHMTKFDPAKRYQYMPRLMPIESIRAGRWQVDQVRTNFQKLMQTITTPPAGPTDRDEFKDIREWNNGVEGTDDNPANQPLVGQMVFSAGVIWNDLATQTMRILHDLYRGFKEVIRELRKHVKYAPGKESSVYWNIAKERSNKILAAVVPLSVQPLSYYELLAATLVS